VAAEVGLDDAPEDCQEPTQEGQPRADLELAIPDEEADSEDSDPGNGDCPAIPSQAQIAPLTLEAQRA